VTRDSASEAASPAITLDDPIPRQIPDWAALPDQQAIRSELHALLRRAIGELPEPYRCVLLLREFEDLSTRETAEILDVSEDVVKTRLHRARAAVKHKLGETAALGRPANPAGSGRAP
jgi:RNA polymerase sigma-70 factor (ECF subfamily)